MPIEPNAEGIYTCAICKAGTDSVRSLMMHVTKKHAPIKSKEYYDRYVKGPTEGICPVCGKPTKFRSVTDGYRECCSHECFGKNFANDKDKVNARQEKSKATCMERYGVENGGGTKAALEKAQKTNLERRGVKWNMQSVDVVEKSKQTCLEKYGTTTYVHSEEGTERANATVQEKFGRANFFSGPEGNDAARAGMKAKYGVEHNMQRPDVVDARKAAEMEKYGGKLFLQTDEFKEKSRETQFVEYGTWFSASPEGRARYREIMMEMTGVPEWFQSQEFKEKSKRTMLETRGVENISQTQEWHDKVRVTSMERYGAPHYAQSDMAKMPAIEKYNRMFAPYGCHIIRFGNKQEITYMCSKCGSESTEQAQFAIYRAMSNATPCTHCSPKNPPVSFEEAGLAEFVRSLGVEVTHHDRNFLGDMGADIVVESCKTIIEYDGVFWHSEQFKDAGYHLRKKILAEEAGYRLIHVFSDEWIYKQDIVKSRLATILGRWNTYSSRRVYARDCQVREVLPQDAVAFLEANHLQGGINSKYRYALYDGDDMVALMTFGMSRFEKDMVELHRYCCDIRVAVVGGAGKLFSAFLADHPGVIEMVSYADARWSTKDSFYTKLGFELDSMSAPGYYIVVDDRRHNRMEFQRHKIAGPGDEGKTEHEITLERGLHRIYDCGQYRYVWKKST